ncbi:MAG: hypothetical protein HY927_13760 [Elusimicrobia bacterium]|nr:hypothetical protein [Elusimicrobiota bacterium]
MRVGIIIGILAFSMSPFSLAGCMLNGTRRTPVTPAVPAKTSIPRSLRDRRVAVFLDASAANVGGGHHEGMLQVRQPWIYGLSKDQRELLYGNAPHAAALAFTAELRRQGVDAFWLHDLSRGILGKKDLLVTGKVDEVVLNTYGGGTKEGFGSAGKYWEAVVRLSLGLKEKDGAAPLWEGAVESYAKLSPCPAQLDWTMLTLTVKALEGAVGMQKLSAAKGLDVLSAGKSYAATFEGSYQLEPSKTTPIEVAARHAAVEFLKRVGR